MQNQVLAQETYSGGIQPSISLVLDQNATAGTSLYVADISITDTKGNAIDSVWSAITKAFNSVVGFALAVWDNIVGPILGAVMELVKSVVNIIIEGVKNFVSDALKTLSSSPNPEDTKTYVTQQLFKQDTIQTYQGVYNSQTSIVDPTNPFGPLAQIMPIVQPLMQIGSIGSLISSFITLPKIIVDLINIIGSGGILSIIFEVINTIVTKAIQVLFDQLIKPIMSTLLNVFSIQSLFSSDEISYIEAVQNGGTINTNINFNDLYNKVIFLPFQIFETIKGIPEISIAFSSLINGTIDIVSGIVGFIHIFVSAIDIDLLSSFIFQLISRMFFSFATYLTYDMNQHPTSPGDYTSNTAILGKELILDSFGILTNCISWLFAQRMVDLVKFQHILYLSF